MKSSRSGAPQQGATESEPLGHLSGFVGDFLTRGTAAGTSRRASRSRWPFARARQGRFKCVWCAEAARCPAQVGPVNHHLAGNPADRRCRWCQEGSIGRTWRQDCSLDEPAIGRRLTIRG